MKKLIVSLVAIFSLSTVVNADDQVGCGLGTVWLGKQDSAVMLSIQATTNGTSGSQTFGISSGTSGCKGTKFVMSKKAQEFVASNMDQLSKEIAMGKGESVDTLAELLNVKDNALFASNLQANYVRIYTSKNVKMSNVLDNISTI
jgi:hypothetical protein